MQIFGIVGYFYHSLHYYFKLFETSIIEISTLIHAFSIVLFYSTIGLTLASLVNIDNLKKKRKKAILFSLIGVYLIKDFSFINNHLFYLGSIINGIAAVSFFTFFSMIPVSNNKKIILMISIITNYTGGVYYLHVIIWKIFSRKMYIFKKGTLSSCFLNYIICYFICFIGEKKFIKSKLKYLFK